MSPSDLEDEVIKCSDTQLKSYEEDLRERPAVIPAIPSPYVYLFCTDRRMMPEQHRRHRVLALAGHPVAKLIVIASQAEHKEFYGLHVSCKHIYSKSVL